MAGYYNNPYNYMPTVYPQMNTPSYAMQPAVNMPTQAQPQQHAGIIWVDGEVGAKAYQLNGQTGPVALWDTNDTVIYLKSMNQMGMPNPLQKIRYQMEEPPAGMINGGTSGADGNSGHDGKLQTEIDSLKSDIKELKELMMQQRPGANQNGSKAVQNGERGGNR